MTNDIAPNRAGTTGDADGAAIKSVAIAIVSFRGVADVLGCLAALEQQSFTAFSVCICENGGEAAFAAMQRAVPPHLAGGQPVSLIADHSNPGYAGGVNRCITHTAGADAWWVLNPDTVPHPDALAAMVATAQTGQWAAVGGIVIDSGSNRTNAGGGWWRAWAARVVANFVTLDADHRITGRMPERPLDYITGGSLFATRQLVDTIGLMREDYFLYAEEVEWCLRARAAGLRLGVATGAIIDHAQGQSTGSAKVHRARPRLPIYCDERNRLLVVRDTQPMLLPVAVVAAFAYLTMRYLARGAWRQWGYALAGWWAGIRGERGKPSWLGAG